MAMSWLYPNIILPTCIDGCAMWNRDMADKCMGVTWGFGSYGPLGVRGGNERVFYWDMVGNGYSSSGQDSARLQSQTISLVFFVSFSF
jgi:hypothetical protein